MGGLLIFFLLVLLCPLWEISLFTAAARAAVPIVCRIFLCPNSGMAASVPDFFSMHTDVDACDCTQGLHEHCERVCTGS